MEKVGGVLAKMSSTDLGMASSKGTNDTVCVSSVGV